MLATFEISSMMLMCSLFFLFTHIIVVPTMIFVSLFASKNRKLCSMFISLCVLVMHSIHSIICKHFSVVKPNWKLPYESLRTLKKGFIPLFNNSLVFKKPVVVAIVFLFVCRYRSSLSSIQYSIYFYYSLHFTFYLIAPSLFIFLFHTNCGEKLEAVY